MSPRGCRKASNTAKRKKYVAVAGGEKVPLQRSHGLAQFGAPPYEFNNYHRAYVNLTTSLGVKHILATIFA